MIPKVRCRRRRGKLQIIWPKRRLVDDETRDISFGCVSLNVSLARGHGWSEKAIERTAKALSKIAKRESGRAASAHPERFKEQDGMVIFLGEIDLWGNWLPPGGGKKRWPHG